MGQMTSGNGLSVKCGDYHLSFGHFAVKSHGLSAVEQPQTVHLLSRASNSGQPSQIVRLRVRSALEAMGAPALTHVLSESRNDFA